MEKLPDELLLAVLCRLPSEDLLQSCRGVCRRWRGLALDASLWRRRELVLERGSAAGAVRTVCALRVVPCLSSLRLALPTAGPAVAALEPLLDAACHRPLNLSRLELSTGSAWTDADDEDDPGSSTEDAAKDLAPTLARMFEMTYRQLQPNMAGLRQSGGANDLAVASDAARPTAESIAHALLAGNRGSTSTSADQDALDAALDAAKELAPRGLVRVLRAQLSPTLRKLALSFSYLEPQCVRDLFECLFHLPELTDLMLECEPGEQGGPDEMQKMPSRRIRVPQNSGRVTNLHIAGLSDKFAEALVRMQAGSLEHLHLSCPDGLLAVLPVVSEHCTRLHSLSLRGWWKLSNQNYQCYLALEQFFKGATQLKSLRLDYKFHTIFDAHTFGSDDFALLRYILPALASNALVRGGRPASLETLTLDFLHVYHPQHGEYLREALEGLPHLHTIRIDCLSNEEHCSLSDALALCQAPQLRLVELLGCDARVCPNTDEGCSGLTAALRLVRRNPSLHVAGVGLRNGAPWEERWLGVYGHPEEERFACSVCLEHGVGPMHWLSCSQAEDMMKEFGD